MNGDAPAGGKHPEAAVFDSRGRLVYLGRMHGLSQAADGVHGESVFGIGVSGHSIEPGSTAVSGDSTDGVGVQGGSHGGVGVRGNSQFNVAVQGGNVSETEPAIQGWAQNGQTGVMGRSTAFDEFDPIASPAHVGVFGVADRPGGRGVLARSRDGRAIQASGRGSWRYELPWSAASSNRHSPGAS